MEGLGRHFFYFQVFYPAVSASFPAPSDEPGTCILGPSDHYLNGTIGKVLYPSFQHQGPGLVSGSSSETDSLHAAVHCYFILNRHGI